MNPHIGSRPLRLRSCTSFCVLLQALAGRCPALSTLIVDACPSITGSFLQRLATGCPALAKLSIDGTTGLKRSPAHAPLLGKDTYNACPNVFISSSFGRNQSPFPTSSCAFCVTVRHPHRGGRVSSIERSRFPCDGGASARSFCSQGPFRMMFATARRKPSSGLPTITYMYTNHLASLEHRPVCALRK